MAANNSNLEKITHLEIKNSNNNNNKTSIKENITETNKHDSLK